MGLAEAMNWALEPVRRQIRQLVAKAIVDSVDDSGGMQVLQIVVGKDEVLDQVERVQPFGLTSVPEKNDEVVYACIGGEREHAVAIVVDSSAKRVKGLQAGEVAVYRNDANKVFFKADGTIEIHGETKVLVNSPLIELGPDALEAVLNGETFMALYNAHAHTGGFVAPTSPPTVPGVAGVHTSTRVKAAK